MAVSPAWLRCPSSQPQPLTSPADPAQPAHPPPPPSPQPPTYISPTSRWSRRQRERQPQPAPLHRHRLRQPRRPQAHRLHQLLPAPLPPPHPASTSYLTTPTMSLPTATCRSPARSGTTPPPTCAPSRSRPTSSTATANSWASPPPTST